MDDGTYVFIHTAYDPEENCLLTNYVRYEVWEAAEPRVKAMSAARQLKELIRSGCEVFVGYPGEVELWLETTRVYPNLGGCNKFIGPLSLEHLKRFAGEEGPVN